FIVTPPTAIYTLSLHDALPISNHRNVRCSPTPSSNRQLPHHRHIRQIANPRQRRGGKNGITYPGCATPILLVLPACPVQQHDETDRKSTRLNSSHQITSYAVFC